MAAGPGIDVTGWLEEQLAQASPDLLRSVMQNTRNGYRRRAWDTQGRHDRPGDPEAAPGQLLPGLAAGAPPPRRA